MVTVPYECAATVLLRTNAGRDLSGLANLDAGCTRSPLGGGLLAKNVPAPRLCWFPASSLTTFANAKKSWPSIKDALGTDYSSQHHHGYCRTKASPNNEEYRKCASPTHERVEREGTCEG